MSNTKQLKINKLFRKGAVTRAPDDCDELVEELQHLEEKLKEKQNELFQIQRNSYRQKISPPKKKEESFVRPQKIIRSSAVASLEHYLDLMSMLTGVEVQSYVLDEHCCVLYHMQHNSGHEVKHGLRIDIHSDKNVITKSSLPVGFNLKAVMEDFDNVMMPRCLGAIRNALVAYYTRLQQFQALKKLITIQAELFKILDGSHIEITFFAQSEMEAEDEQIKITLILDYRVYDIRPKSYSFKEIDLPEGALETLREQCVVFKRQPLHKAFEEAFIKGVGAYRIVQQLGMRREEPKQKVKRFRPNKQHYNNDDTFLPEECSDQGEDEECAEE